MTMQVKRADLGHYGYSLYSADWRNDHQTRRCEFGFPTEEAARESAFRWDKCRNLEWTETIRRPSPKTIRRHRTSFTALLEYMADYEPITRYGAASRSTELLNRANIPTYGDNLPEAFRQSPGSMEAMAAAITTPGRFRPSNPGDPDSLYRELLDNAEVALGLTTGQGWQFFLGHTGETYWRRAYGHEGPTTSHALRVWRHLLATGEVNWRIGKPRTTDYLHRRMDNYYAQDAFAIHEAMRDKRVGAMVKDEASAAVADLAEDGREIYDLDLSPYMARLLVQTKESACGQEWMAFPRPKTETELSDDLNAIHREMPDSRPYPYEFSRRLARQETEEYERALTKLQQLTDEGAEVVLVDYYHAYLFLVRSTDDDGQLVSEWE